MRQSNLNRPDQVKKLALVSTNSSAWSRSSISSGGRLLNTSDFISTAESVSSTPICIKGVKKKIKEANRTISSRSSDRSSIAFGVTATGNNLTQSCSRELNLNEGKVSKCLQGVSITANSSNRLVRPKTKKQYTAATAKQVAQTQAVKKCCDCHEENPYAALSAATFRRLLQQRKAGGKRRALRVAGSAKMPSRVRQRKPKIDESEQTEMRLCPNLGLGHSHAKLLQEVTPKLLRSSQILNCQLRELYRRLYLMRHSVPQLTAPALIHFQGILVEITRMLVADFSSFQKKLIMINETN